MPLAPPPLPIQAYAPEFARRFRLIMSALLAVIGRRLGRDPRFATIIWPLWNRCNRTANRFQRLMAHLAAGTLPKPRTPREPREPGAPTRSGGPHRPADRLPRGNGWLVRVLGYEAAGLASQLSALLSEPGVAELLALAPTAGRSLNPVKRLLGVGEYVIRQPRPKPKAAPKEALRFEPPGPLAFRSEGRTWYDVVPLPLNRT